MTGNSSGNINGRGSTKNDEIIAVRSRSLSESKNTVLTLWLCEWASVANCNQIQFYTILPVLRIAKREINNVTRASNKMISTFLEHTFISFSIIKIYKV